MSTYDAGVRKQLVELREVVAKAIGRYIVERCDGKITSEVVALAHIQSAAVVVSQMHGDVKDKTAISQNVGWAMHNFFSALQQILPDFHFEMARVKLEDEASAPNLRVVRETPKH